MPKVNGRSLSVAKRRLTASGCTRAVDSDPALLEHGAQRSVIGTSPGTGARTTKKVKLIVSKGKRPKRARVASARPLVERAEAVLRSL